MVDVERLGQIGELVSIRGLRVMAVAIDVEMQVQVVKVDEFCAGKVLGVLVHGELLGSAPRLRSRAVHNFGAGPWAEGREKIGGRSDGRVGLARNWGQGDAAPSHASGGWATGTCDAASSAFGGGVDGRDAGLALYST